MRSIGKQNFGALLKTETEFEIVFLKDFVGDRKYPLDYNIKEGHRIFTRTVATKAEAYAKSAERAALIAKPLSKSKGIAFAADEAPLFRERLLTRRNGFPLERGFKMVYCST